MRVRKRLRMRKVMMKFLKEVRIARAQRKT